MPVDEDKTSLNKSLFSLAKGNRKKKFGHVLKIENFSIITALFQPMTQKILWLYPAPHNQWLNGKAEFHLH